jgi:hypothetical protein
MLGLRYIGALFVVLMAIVFLALLGRTDWAAAAPILGDEDEPLFARCGLEGLGAMGREKVHVAARARGRSEGRSAVGSAASFEQWRATAQPIVPGLLAFGLRLNQWPTPPDYAADDRPRFCPSGERL